MAARKNAPPAKSKPHGATQRPVDAARSERPGPPADPYAQPPGSYRAAAQTEPEELTLGAFQQLTRSAAAKIAAVLVLLRDGDGDGDQDTAAGYAQDPEVSAWLKTVPAELSPKVTVRPAPALSVAPNESAELGPNGWEKSKATRAKTRKKAN